MIRRAILPAIAWLAAWPLAAPASGQAAVPAYRRFVLRNGLLATFVHTGAERKAVVALVLESGEIDEPAFGPGLAALTVSTVLQGTVSRSAARIASEAAAMGTVLDVRAGPTTTTFSGEVASARVPAFLALVSDVVRHPLLDTAGFNRARRRALEALDSAMHDPADVARQQWRAIVFPDGPLGQPYSYAATLNALQLGHVRNVYDEQYVATRTHLYVSGVFDDAATEKAVREIFSDWKAGTPPRSHAIDATAAHQLTIINRAGVDRSVVWIGCPTIDAAAPGFEALEVADLLVAGDDRSRVGADLGRLGAGAWEGGSALWRHRSATYWVDTLLVRTGDTGAAIGAVLGELTALGREAPPDAEVADARRRLISSFEAEQDARGGIVAQLEYASEHGLGDAWLSEHPARLAAVTAADVRTAVSHYLDPARMAIVIVGDRARIEPQLAALAPLVP